MLFPMLTFGSVGSFFENGSEGWTSIGDIIGGVEYVPDGGNPGNGLRVNDETTGGVWYWVAPQKFLGDQSEAYEHDLKFDLRQVISGGANQFGAEDVILEGAGTKLVFTLNSKPATDGTWTSYTISLVASNGWKVDSSAGAGATEAQLQNVLSNLTSLRIRGEYQTGPDVGYLDNVILGGQNTGVPPVLDIAVLPVVSIEGSVGSQLRIEYSDTLASDDWHTLKSLTLTESPTDVVDKSAAGHPNRNYRAVLIQP